MVRAASSFISPPCLRSPRGAWGVTLGLSLTLGFGLSACRNQPAADEPGKARKGVPRGNAMGSTPKSDPRVVEVDGKLYAKAAASVPAAMPKPGPEVQNGRGSGRPDETNGTCRLYAPKFPNPICCTRDYGFDVRRVKEICGHSVYLGESSRQSCGYFFIHDPARAEPTSMRISRVRGDSAKAVADVHDRVFQRRMKNPNFVSSPIPGIDGAFHSHDEGYNWAFLPGWTHVRQVSWLDGFCPREKMFTLLKELAALEEPPADAKRKSLVPGAWKYTTASNEQ